MTQALGIFVVHTVSNYIKKNRTIYINVNIILKFLLRKT